MVITSDDLGRAVRLPARPRRIVSLCPSQTETLLALGLSGRVVGRTRYCIHPAAEVSRITEVGGTKQLRLDALRALQPDLIIAEKEENRREDVEALEREFPVYVTDVRSVDGALRMIRHLGQLCDCTQAAEVLAQQIAGRFSRLQPLRPRRRVAYLIWRKPWMAAGADTYIHDVLTRCGFENVFAAKTGRYPETTLEDIERLAPEVLLLSSEPYPFQDRHRQEFAKRLPGAKVLLVDGEAFSWYGARMRLAADALQRLLSEL
ncbi:MAG TPA: helical backbone metal receptor [Nevskiales bacterium]|nr:helical backbone metal receptor [Nevskiales bacterium]